MVQINAQLQDFENGVPPSGWIEFDNGVGTTNEWFQSTEAVNGNFSAGVLNEFTSGVDSEDWLVTSRFDPPNNTKYVVFKQKQTFSGDYGNTYSIRVSTVGGTPVPSDYTIVEQWDETSFSTEWSTKIVDVSSFNSQIYVAFVMTQSDGDNWFIDDAELVDDPVIPNCTTNPLPTSGAVNTSLFQNAITLNWDAPAENVSEYEIFFGTTSGALSSIGKAFTNSFEVPNLDYSTTYYWRAVPMNPAGTATACTEWSFTTKGLPTGSDCSDPIIINTFPFNASDNTGNFENIYNLSSCEPSYISGYDVVYAYTPVTDTSIDILLSGIDYQYTAVHVFDDCPDAMPTCIASFANDDTLANIDLQNIYFSNGITYYIVISTAAGPKIKSTSYTIDVTENSCFNLSADFTIVGDCNGSGGFYVDVGITDLGSATSLTIVDNQGFSNSNINAIGITQLGPYANGTNVLVTVTNNQDNTCEINSDSLTQLSCPPSNDLCSSALEIIPSTIGSEVWVLGTTIGTTPSGEVNASGISCVGSSVFGEGNDTWFKIRVPIAGDITIMTRAVGGSDLSDTYITVFDGNCGLLSEVGCDLDGEFNFPFSELELTNMPVDDILYIRVSKQNGNDGEFEISGYALDPVLNIEVESLSDIIMFPNPANEMLNFKTNNSLESIQIFNVIGQEVLNKKLNQRESTIDISYLNPGVYLVKVKSQEIFKSFRLIKE